MLKIVYPICCGIDVHKTFLVACIESLILSLSEPYAKERTLVFAVPGIKNPFLLSL